MLLLQHCSTKGVKHESRHPALAQIMCLATVLNYNQLMLFFFFEMVVGKMCFGCQRFLDCQVKCVGHAYF